MSAISIARRSDGGLAETPVDVRRHPAGKAPKIFSQSICLLKIPSFAKVCSHGQTRRTQSPSRSRSR
ncbi:hypothetical protein LP416_18660 [Polaromonas sp. P2-4]|nr:hypothetical protein LP416_18660 [Polaromonas sp. P2-4]